jgi:hypothetical protein
LWARGGVAVGTTRFSRVLSGSAARFIGLVAVAVTVAT